MKRLLFALALLLQFAAPSAMAETWPVREVGQYCDDLYSSGTERSKRCFQRQYREWGAWASTPANVPADYYNRILNLCATKYFPDIATMVRCKGTLIVEGRKRNFR